MHRISSELLMTVVAAVLMASLVLIIGVAIPAGPLALATRQIEPPDGETGTCLEAPATAPSTSVTVGVGTLCVEGHDLRVTLRVTGLSSGEKYTGILRYALRPSPCRDSPCGPIDLPGNSPTGLIEQINDGIAPPTGVLSVQKELNDVRLLGGSEVALILLSLSGKADPHAQAVFILL